MNLLRIDAWADSEPGSWSWNAWYKVGEVDSGVFLDKVSNRQIFTDAMGQKLDWRKYEVEDDQYNLVLFERKSGRPLFAIEHKGDYGM